jgi:hypothetical protein
LRYARRLMRNNKSVSIFIMDVNQVLQTSAKVREATDELRKMFPNSVKIIKSSKNNASVISKFSFLLLSYQAWNNLSENDAAMLRSIPSTLIINKKTHGSISGMLKKTRSWKPITNKSFIFLFSLNFFKIKKVNLLMCGFTFIFVYQCFR